MEHPSILSRPIVWRTTALAAAAVATFELVLLLLIGLAFVGDRPARDAAADVPRTTAAKKASPAPKRAKKRAPVAKLPRGETSVIVLNGNGVQGAAGEAADLVRTFRYVIAGTANAPRTDFERSIVMFRPGYRGEAIRLARDLRIQRVAPLDGLRPADLQGAQVALIVGGS